MRQKLPVFLKQGCLFLWLSNSSTSHPFSFFAAGAPEQQRAVLAVGLWTLPPILIPIPGAVWSCLRCHQRELVPRCRFEGLAARVICDQPAEPAHPTAIRDLLERKHPASQGWNTTQTLLKMQTCYLPGNPEPLTRISEPGQHIGMMDASIGAGLVLESGWKDELRVCKRGHHPNYGLGSVTVGGVHTT